MSVNLTSMSRGVVTQQIDQEVQTANFFSAAEKAALGSNRKRKADWDSENDVDSKKRVQSDRVPSSNIITGLLVLCIVNV
jgi:hypothetical protein